MNKTAPEPPIAWVISVTPNPDHPHAALLKVACPFCQGWHIHGEPDAPHSRTEFGTRASHCQDQHAAGSYLLKLAPPNLVEQLRAERAQCTATTATGARCSRKATGRLGAARCRQHEEWRRCL